MIAMPLICVEGALFWAEECVVEVKLDDVNRHHNPYRWIWNRGEMNPNGYELLSDGRIVQLVHMFSPEIGTMRFHFFISLE